MLDINNKDFKVFNQKHIKIEDFSIVNIKVFPLDSEQFNSYCFYLTIVEDSIKSNNDNILIYNLNNEVYVILPVFYADKSLLFSQDDITIKNGITLYYNNAKLIKERFCAIYCDYKKFGDYNLYMLKGINDNLLIAMRGNNIEFISKYFKIEFDENKILLVENLYDMFNHGMVREYQLISDNLQKTNEYSVYLSNNVETIKDVRLIACAFLDCGKAKNINLAKNFLSKNLQSHFSQQNFDDYFKTFKNYYVVEILGDSQKILLEYENELTIFEFKLNGGNIVDIDKISKNKNIA